MSSCNETMEYLSTEIEGFSPQTGSALHSVPWENPSRLHLMVPQQTQCASATHGTLSFVPTCIALPTLSN